MSENKLIYILYGSQTGNAEFIAKELSLKLNDLKIANTCQTLNSVKKVDLKSLSKLLIIICSTTGNGDCPENADMWWRSIKVRSASKDLFQDIPYTVLGLGDTNYDKFCYLGKSIDKRLNELGGKREMELCCADEAVGLEEVIEAWKVKILQFITSNYNDTKVSIVENNIENSNDISKEQIKLSNEIIDSDCSKIIEEYSIIQKKIDDNLLNPLRICEHLKFENIFNNPPENNILPKRKNEPENCIRFNILPSEDSTHHNVPIEYTQENPYYAEIINSHWLTKDNDTENSKVESWGESKRVIHTEISISNSNIDYQPGDSIGICCPNPSFLVNIIYNRIKDYHINENITLDSIVYNSNNNEFKSLHDILTYRLDLTGPLRKSNVILLANYCRNKEESNFILWLCSNSPVGKQLWNEFIELQGLGLAEFLELIPSCYPPLYILLSFPKLLPRYYSIASSPLAYPNSISIAYSVERYTKNIPNSSLKIRRYGLCTTYLENLLQPFLRNDNNKPPIFISIFHKPTINFRMPGSLAHPMILIGPGTGIAPFIGFLQHREFSTKERQHSGENISTGVWRGGFELDENDLPSECNLVGEYIRSVDIGPLYLFYGCRNENDFLYKNELEYFQQIGIITKLEVAQSRISKDKVYVTHKLNELGKEICDLIINKGSYIYICGDGNNMAKSVHLAFKNILMEFNSFSDKEASDYIEEMKVRRRYLLDIWS